MKRKRMHSHKDLTTVIKGTIARFYVSTEPTAREVGDAVIREHPELIRDVGADFARSHVYTLCSNYMKASLETHGGNGFKQLKLDIAIDGIPDAISFPSEGDIRYVDIRRAKKKHVLAYVKLLRGQIGNDTRKLRAVETLSGMLTDVWEEHPDATVVEALKIYRGDDEPDPPQDGVPATT